jgi:uncharacterized protein (TIGR02001 family)
MKAFLPAACALFLWSGSAAAQSPTDPPRDITVSGGVTAVSDYRFRGISHSDRRPAVQGGVTVDHVSGVYARVWGSSIHDYVAGNAPAEIDLSAGYRRSFGGATVDAGVLYYLYPDAGAAASDFFEPYASVAYTLGPVTAKLSAAYAPRQSALSVGRGREDNLHLSGDLSGFVPGTPVTVAAHLGHNSGPTQLGLADDYTDWSLAANYTVRGLTFGLAYVDTDARVRTPRGRNAAGAGVVASIAFGF